MHITSFMSSFPSFLFFKSIVNCYQNPPSHIGVKNNLLLHQEEVCNAYNLNPTVISRSPNNYFFYKLKWGIYTYYWVLSSFHISVIEYVWFNCLSVKMVWGVNSQIGPWQITLHKNFIHLFCLKAYWAILIGPLKPWNLFLIIFWF